MKGVAQLASEDPAVFNVSGTLIQVRPAFSSLASRSASVVFGAVGRSRKLALLVTISL